jgi:uncharacterized protein (DUF1697 family)
MQSMETYISILRGINVGGHRKIPMKDLKQMLDKLGYQDVTTYIQSGNVVFRSGKGNSPAGISNEIEKAISLTFGFEVPVITRSMHEWKQTLSENPLLHDAGLDVDKFHVTFLEREPEPALADNLSMIDFSLERLVIRGKDVYLYCPDGYGNSKLTNSFFENKLKVTATTRNWRTVIVLGELANKI